MNRTLNVHHEKSEISKKKSTTIYDALIYAYESSNEIELTIKLFFELYLANGTERKIDAYLIFARDLHTVFCVWPQG